MIHPVVNGYYYFSGNDLILTKSTFPGVRNDFTYELWAKPEAKHQIDAELISGVSGVWGKRYVIGPEHGMSADEAGTGISIGTNGISVYEHTANHMPATLVYDGLICGWTHIAVVYRDRTPYLYVNGKFVKAGLRSAKANVYACGTIGGHKHYGGFIGDLKDVKIWGNARTEEEIRKAAEIPVVGYKPGLIGSWKFGDGNGIIESDDSGNGTTAEVIGATWLPERPFLKGKIGMIISSSQYDATRHFAFEMTSAFLQLDYRVEVIDLSRSSGAEKLEVLLRQPDLRFLIGMNGHGIAQLFNRLCAGSLPVPFLSYFVDHPMFHLDRFDFHQKMHQLIVSCVDFEHLFYLSKYFRGKFAMAFAPQAAMNPLPVRELKTIKHRSIEILFAGTNLNPNEYRRRWAGDPRYGALLDEIAERAIYQYGHSLMSIAEETFRNRGIPFQYPEDQRLVGFLQQLDYYIRGRRRLEILDALSDLPVMVYTNDATGLPNKGRIRYLPPVDLKSFQALMYDSKMVLNVLANLVYGGHERIFTAMQAGAVSLTDQNKFLTERFRHKKNIVFINYRKRDLSDEIGAMLENPDLLQSIADEARTILPEQTWYARAKQLLRAVGRDS